jgi:hypothetical protein
LQNPTYQYASRGEYPVTLTVTTDIGSNSSVPFVIQVGTPVGITAQPQGLKRYTGQGAEFSLETEGGLGALHYQWKCDSEKKAINDLGPDAPVLRIPTVTLDSVGGYFCEITDESTNHYFSSTATLEVGDPLEITQQPQGATKPAGESYTFTVGAAGGIGELSYTWRKGNDPLAGETRPSYSIAPLTIADSGSYSVVVFDQNTATLQSDPAVLEVSAAGLPVSGVAALVGLGLALAACAAFVVHREKGRRNQQT